MLICWFFFMRRDTTKATRADTIFPYTTLCRSVVITRPLSIIATKTVAHTRGGDESFEWVDAEDLHGIDLLADLASPHVRADRGARGSRERKSTRLNSSH